MRRKKSWTIRTIFVKGAINNYQNGANYDTSEVEKVSQKTPLFENVCRELTLSVLECCCWVKAVLEE